MPSQMESPPPPLRGGCRADGRTKKATDPEHTDFQWQEAQAVDEVVQQAVNRVAIYGDIFGDVAIRRNADWDEDRDVVIVIGRNNAVDAARAILKAAGLDDDFGIAPKAQSKAAERQRRYRQRKRDGGDVTPRDVDRDVPVTPNLKVIAAE